MLRLFVLCAGRARSGCRAASSSCGEHTLPLSAVASFCVWGSNTGVGKTLVSAGLAAHEAATGAAVLYVKPLQTGFPDDSDGAFLAQAVRHVAPASTVAHTLGGHAAATAADASAAAAAGGSAAPRGRAPLADAVPRVSARTLFAWHAAVGPHLAVAREGRAVADHEVSLAVAEELRNFARAYAGGRACAVGTTAERVGHALPLPPLVLVETAGGVSSPGPGGALQCDLLRSLRLPAVLVGDGRLGGVSTTLCALDALTLRGYTIEAVVMLECEQGLHNADAVRQHLPLGTPLVSLPALPAPADGAPDGAALGGSLPPHVQHWLRACAPQFAGLAATLRQAHTQRVADLAAAPALARATLWWPFTQHDDVRNEDVTVIDARSGDELLVHDAQQASMRPLLDACGSWWTQGVSAELQPRLARVIGHAAGRWGHVMYPENAHEPALGLAARLLDGPGRGWAQRVFFSDDGSTAVEVALKIALRAYAFRQGLLPAPPLLRVLALTGSYHGDTLGAAQAQAPSVFTGPTQAPWYSLRGVFVEPPTAALSADGWQLTLPRELAADLVAAGVSDEALSFASLEALFSASRDATPLGRAYRHAISSILSRAAAQPEHGAVGAAIIEPVLHGASGMVLVDPAFQRAVASMCASAKVPLIADEVFSGLWRLGAPAASQLLGVQPDIACYAKLLTGGTVPLAATLASEEVFDAFRGSAKTDALLHGHSYSAHPIGCAAACAALDMFAHAATNPNLLAGPQRLRELWEPALVSAVCAAPGVARVVCVGTVFAAELAPVVGAAGYHSNAARGVVKRLRKHGVFARPLGNVVYLMVTPVAPPATCTRLLKALLMELHAPSNSSRLDGRRGVVC